MSYLQVIATQVANAIDGLLGDLDGRLEPLRAGHAAPDLPPSLGNYAETAQDNDRLLCLPEWLPRIKLTKNNQLRISAAQPQRE